jgi:magnesium transporter
VSAAAPIEASAASGGQDALASDAANCPTTVVEFDFSCKVERSIELASAKAAMARGLFVWIDVDVANTALARKLLQSTGLLMEEVVEDVLVSEPSTQHARYDQFIHLVVSGCRWKEHAFDLERVDVIIAERFLMTLHRGPAVFLQSVKKDYRADFVRFARSPSFLIYELWDHLLENYLSVQKRFEERVEKLQAELHRDNVDDRVFVAISELGADLLHFRKVLLPARAVLTDLSTRKTIFISEATQPFLANMVGTVEHCLQDLLVDRDILAESLNLYMSLVSHRTNAVMKRLTIVSVIFLPLTFLVGVYGMNFEFLPELRWHYGYAYFWGLAAFIVVGLIWLLKRHRML